MAAACKQGLLPLQHRYRGGKEEGGRGGRGQGGGRKGGGRGGRGKERGEEETGFGKVMWKGSRIRVVYSQL